MVDRWGGWGGEEKRGGGKHVFDSFKLKKERISSQYVLEEDYRSYTNLGEPGVCSNELCEVGVLFDLSDVNWKLEASHASNVGL